MKFWKNNKGDCGTMDDNAIFPIGFVKATKVEYDHYVKSLHISEPKITVYEFEDIDTGKKYNVRRVNSEVKNVESLSVGSKLRKWVTERIS